MFMGRVIVSDDVDSKIHGYFAVNLAQKSPPFLTPVLLRDPLYQLTFKIIERRKQGQCASPRIIMRARLDMAYIRAPRKIFACGVMIGG
jgi:hypothetical protein